MNWERILCIFFLFSFAKNDTILARSARPRPCRLQLRIIIIVLATLAVWCSWAAVVVVEGVTPSSLPLSQLRRSFLLQRQTGYFDHCRCHSRLLLVFLFWLLFLVVLLLLDNIIQHCRIVFLFLFLFLFKFILPSVITPLTRFPTFPTNQTVSLCGINVMVQRIKIYRQRSNTHHRVFLLTSGDAFSSRFMRRCFFAPAFFFSQIFSSFPFFVAISF